MDVSTGGGEHYGDDWVSASNWDYVAAFILWWNKYDVCSIWDWAGFTNFVLY